MLSSVDMLRIHSIAWTEPVFIFFGLSGLFLLCAYLQNRATFLLIASSGAIALAFLSRYAGVTLVITGIAALFLSPAKSNYRKIVDSITFVTISSLPMALWMIRNWWLTGSTTERTMFFHPITANHLKTALNTVSIWLLPRKLSPMVRQPAAVALVAAFIALNILVIYRQKWSKRNFLENKKLAQMPRLLLIFITVYCLFLVLSISLFDAHTPLDYRILAPVYASAVVLVMCLIYNLFTLSTITRSIRIICVVLFMCFGAFYCIRATGWITRIHKGGIGYAREKWRHSPIIKQIKSLSPDTPIFSNGTDAIYILTGRRTWQIPSKVNPNTGQANPLYLSGLAIMREHIESKGALLVYFNKISWRWYLPLEEELRESLPIRVLMSAPDGSIYGAGK